jgi:hypothetical protein
MMCTKKMFFRVSVAFLHSESGENSNLNPVVVYENFDTQKDQILQENKDKCGVYRLTNITPCASRSGPIHP